MACATRSASPSTALSGGDGDRRRRPGQARGGRLRAGARAGSGRELRLELPARAVCRAQANRPAVRRSLGEEDFAQPVFDYPHADPEGGGACGCAIIGGYVARGPGLGSLYGRYLYGDHLRRGNPLLRTPADPAATDRSEGIASAEPRLLRRRLLRPPLRRLRKRPVYRIVGGPSSCPLTSTPPPALTLLHRHPRRQPSGQAPPPRPDQRLGRPLRGPPRRPGHPLTRTPATRHPPPRPRLLGPLPAADRPPLQFPRHRQSRHDLRRRDLTQADDPAAAPPLLSPASRYFASGVRSEKSRKSLRGSSLLDQGRVERLARLLGDDLRAAHEEPTSLLMLDREPVVWTGPREHGLGWVEGDVRRPSRHLANWRAAASEGVCGLVLSGRRRLSTPLSTGWRRSTGSRTAAPSTSRRRSTPSYAPPERCSTSTGKRGPRS